MCVETLYKFHTNYALSFMCRVFENECVILCLYFLWAKKIQHKYIFIYTQRITTVENDSVPMSLQKTNNISGALIYQLVSTMKFILSLFCIRIQAITTPLLSVSFYSDFGSIQIQFFEIPGNLKFLSIFISINNKFII